MAVVRRVAGVCISRSLPGCIWETPPAGDVSRCRWCWILAGGVRRFAEPRVGSCHIRPGEPNGQTLDDRDQGSARGRSGRARLRVQQRNARLTLGVLCAVLVQ